MKTLIVVDMQNDFIDGSLGTKEAQAIVQKVAAKIREYQEAGDQIIFTRDTHGEDYLETPEGKEASGGALHQGNEGMDDRGWSGSGRRRVHRQTEFWMVTLE